MSEAVGITRSRMEDQVTGGWPTRTAPGHTERFTIWARHDKVVVRGVKPWMPVVSGLAGQRR